MKSLTTWKFYIAISIPFITSIVPIIMLTANEQRTLGVTLLFSSLLISAAFAHLVSSKDDNISITEINLNLGKHIIPLDEINFYQINDAGIGIRVLEIYTITGEKKSFIAPTYKKNAKRMIQFTENYFKELKQKQYKKWG